MKKLLLSIVVAVFAALTVCAQDSAESSYVYTYLHWSGKGYKAYGGMLLLNPSSSDQPITDAEGATLEFPNWTYAMNYLATQGWEFVCFDEQNPESIGQKDRYILIRKKMARDEAAPYAEPSKKK